jgi:hypothetical protein
MMPGQRCQCMHLQTYATTLITSHVITLMDVILTSQAVHNLETYILQKVVPQVRSGIDLYNDAGILRSTGSPRRALYCRHSRLHALRHIEILQCIAHRQVCCGPQGLMHYWATGTGRGR